MANVNSPFGFRLVGMLTGGIGNVSIRRYRIPASETHAIFLGDPVMRMAGSSILARRRIPRLTSRKVLSMSREELAPIMLLCLV